MSLAGSALDLRLKSVLLATDLSPTSAKSLHHALAIARHYRAKLYVAHVVSPVPYLMAGPEALELAHEGASGEAQQLQRDLLHDGSLNGLDHVFIIRSGGIWEESSKNKSTWSCSERTAGAASKNYSSGPSLNKSFEMRTARF